jgi:hypothetical protein
MDKISSLAKQIIRDKGIKVSEQEFIQFFQCAISVSSVQAAKSIREQHPRHLDHPGD